MSKTTRELLEKAVADLKSFADDCDAKGGVLCAEDQAELVRRMTEVGDLEKSLKTANDARAAITDSTAFLSAAALPASVVKSLADVSAPAVQRAAKSLGAAFTESDAYADFGKRFRGVDGIIPASTKGINSLPFQSGVDLKTLVTGASATSAGAAVVNDHLAAITDLVGERELRVADLVTRGSTTSDTVEYVRVTSKTNAAASVAEATSGSDGAKPESAMALEVVTTTVKTLAHWIPMTKRAASDAAQVRTLVDSFLAYGLNEEAEDQMIVGAGAGEDFTGILNTANILSVGSTGTDIDAIVDAIRSIRYTGRRQPTALVVNPNDWYSDSFLLAKNGVNGGYLIADPRGSNTPQLWGLDVVVSEAITEGTALVGDFRQAVLWDREGISLSITDSHSDYFIRNILVILAEMRAAFGVLDPQAFCKVTSV